MLIWDYAATGSTVLQSHARFPDLPQEAPAMTQPRWQPAGPFWDQVQQLQSELNHLFQRWTGPNTGRGDEGGSFPPVNLWEDADSVTVEAELPGLTSNDIEIYVTGGSQLTLKGERKPDAAAGAVWHRQERGFGTFVRTLSLPFDVDADKVDARCENGVLRVRLPKHAAARPRKINVKGQ
jgi:HSP20 family protein